jgi:hypothetical protein
VNTHYNAGADGRLTKSGTANRLCTFAVGYIEVLGAVADTPLADQLNAALKRYTGLHLIAFSHPNMASQRRRMMAAGFEVQPTVRLRRPIQTPEGEKTVRASVVRVKPGVMAEGRVQMLTHETPELIWLPRYSDHPNAADALTALLIVSEDAESKARQYARLTGGEPVCEGDVHTVTLARGHLTFASPESAQTILPELAIPSLPYIGAVAIRSADLGRTRKALRDRGVKPLVENEAVVWVHPGDGVGAYIVFHSAETDAVWTRLTAEQREPPTI